jgi:hypothetical protein
LSGLRRLEDDHARARVRAQPAFALANASANFLRCRQAGSRNCLGRAEPKTRTKAAVSNKRPVLIRVPETIWSKDYAMKAGSRSWG